MTLGGKPSGRGLSSRIERFRRSELGGLTGDTGYMAVIQGSELGADLVQIVLITHALGLAEFGRFSLVVAFVMLVGGILNLRVGIVATTLGARHLRSEPRSAAGVFQLTYLMDLSSGAVSVGVVALLSLLVGTGVVGGVEVEIVLIYTVVLLARTVDTVPGVILRLLDRFRLVATTTFATELARVALVFLALRVDESLLAVVAAIAISRLGGALVRAILAFRVFFATYPDARLTRPAIDRLGQDDRRTIRQTIFHSNLISYEGIAQVQIPTLLLGGLAGARETGLYKVGMAIAAVVGNAAAPASAALLPRVSRLWAEGRFDDLRRILRQATLVSLPAIALLYLAVVLFRDPLLELLGGGPEATAAGTVLILGGAGAAVYAALFWRGSLLYAAHRTGAVAAVTMIGAVLQVGAVLALVPSLGAEGAALAFFLSRLFINVTLGGLSISTLRRAGRTQ